MSIKMCIVPTYPLIGRSEIVKINHFYLSRKFLDAQEMTAKEKNVRTLQKFTWLTDLVNGCDLFYNRLILPIKGRCPLSSCKENVQVKSGGSTFWAI